MQCQRCESERMVYSNSKASERNYLAIGPMEEQKNIWGRIPCDMGIGEGNYMQFDYCLDCGQIRGNWPLPETELEGQDEWNHT